MGHYYTGWQEVEKTSFRCVSVYGSMKWGGSGLGAAGAVARSRVAVGAFGGPVAVAECVDETGAALRAFPISLHTAAGQTTGRVAWSGGALLWLGWTSREDLVVLTTDGKVSLFSMFGQDLKDAAFSMGGEVAELGALEARGFETLGGTGLAVLAGSFRVFIVNNVYDPKIWRSAEIPRRAAERPSAWTLMEREGAVRVLFILKAEVFVMTKGKSLPELVVPTVSQAVKRYVGVAASRDGSRVALLSENGLVQVLSADLRQCHSETDGGVRSGVDELLWCGSEAVGLFHGGDTLTLLGTEGGTAEFVLDDGVALAEDWAGIRVLSPQDHRLVEEVPKAVQRVYQVASRAPGATLLESSRALEAGSHLAYEYRRMVERRLGQAVRECTEAAGAEWERESQRQLLKAASFGKLFLSAAQPQLVDEETSRLVLTSRKLRVLNAVREPMFGLALSWAQLERLSEGVLVDRLIGRGQWPLAMSVAEELRLEPSRGRERVLGHWATRLVQAEAARPGDKRIGNQVLADAISDKFRQFPGISYADIASKAAKSGLKELANILLEKEPQIVRQVNLLLQLENHPKALSKACQSGDPDLIGFVVLELKRKMSHGEFLLGLRKFPLALALYKQMCVGEGGAAGEAGEQVRSLYAQDDDHVSLALSHLREAARADATFDVKEKQDCLGRAEASLGSAREEALSHATHQQIKLLKLQADLEEAVPGTQLIDLPLRGTVLELLRVSQDGRAEGLRKEFGVAERRWWWWKVEGLAQAGRFADLQALGKSKKSPIGYLAFLEACARAGAAEEAGAWVGRLVGEERVRGLARLGRWAEAVAAATELGDPAFKLLLNRCPPSARHQVADLVAKARQQASSK